MKRRAFIAGLAGAAVARPLAGRAQQGERVRRVGVLMYTTPDEPELQARITALAQGLQEAGWSVGRNLRIDVRWASGDLTRLRNDAADLVALRPDVIVAGVGPTTSALQQEARAVPIVMAQAGDPVGAGFVRSIARPGGNTTGFTQFEFALAGKWLELLKEIAPQVTRVGIVREPIGQVGFALGRRRSRCGASRCRTQPDQFAHRRRHRRRRIRIRASSEGRIDRARGTVATIQRELIIGLAARHKLPAVYPYRFFVEAGGLALYGPQLMIVPAQCQLRRSSSER